MYNRKRFSEFPKTVFFLRFEEETIGKTNIRNVEFVLLFPEQEGKKPVSTPKN